MHIDRRTLLGAVAMAAAFNEMAAHGAPARALRGFNLIETADAPFGSAKAARSMLAIRASGADAVALIPFLWQPAIASPEIVLGDALPLTRLRLAIRQARDLGLAAVVKPHVWVPHSWAG